MTGLSWGLSLKMLITFMCLMISPLIWSSHVRSLWRNCPVLPYPVHHYSLCCIFSYSHPDLKVVAYSSPIPPKPSDPSTVSGAYSTMPHRWGLAQGSASINHTVGIRIVNPSLQSSIVPSPTSQRPPVPHKV